MSKVLLREKASQICVTNPRYSTSIKEKKFPLDFKFTPVFSVLSATIAQCQWVRGTAKSFTPNKRTALPWSWFDSVPFAISAH